MRKADRLNEICVDVERIRKWRVVHVAQPSGDGFTDLRDFEGVGEAGSVEIVFARPEDLCLVLQPTECGRVKDSVTIDLERATEVTGI